MASKTTLPIARLRALGCRVGTLPGHWPAAPKAPCWQYVITLPEGVEVPISAKHGTLKGIASAHVGSRDGRRIVVRAFRPGDGTTRIIKADREAIEADVAHLLTRIADTLNGR